MYTIGTAGHVDHGKSTLIQALTGIDPDRLREEKERGLTIDLGFAWLTLPSGKEISIVDVPGHERFIKNMLAGVGGIDAALLVIAADEGVMPQTREHLDILDLLRVPAGILVLTRCDLVEDEDWLELVEEDVRETVAGTVLAQSPLVRVSSLRGEGLDDLRAALDTLLADTAAKRDVGRPRLPIDRAFTLTGFGTVVTGTLLDGQLRVGNEVEIVPGNVSGRIRGLQSHKHKIETALPGNRVAVNVGGVDVEDIYRGQVLSLPRMLQATRFADVRIRLLPSAPRPLEHGMVVTLHSGTMETLARVRLLDREEIPPGEEGLAQLLLIKPVSLIKGDLFIVRQLSPAVTLGGGEVLDPYPPRHKRFAADVVSALETLERGSPADVVLQAIRQREPCTQQEVTGVLPLTVVEVEEVLARLMGAEQVIDLGRCLYSAGGWASITERVTSQLEQFHARYPLRNGQGKEEVRRSLGLESRIFNEIVQRLCADEVIAEREGALRAFDFRIELSPTQEEAAATLLALLEREPLAPPSLSDIREELAVDDDFLNVLVEQGRIIQVDTDLIYSRQAYEQAVEKVRELLAREERVTVAQVRDVFGTSRKYVLPLLEQMDRDGITLRDGDERTLAK
ncbi:MAG: selenocysteine-specific translation elongation factor [Chloroflexota bacterium]|nr:selenocysteine-specific translation elongation factor [Chloroflexota bacterium]MDE2932113.1 selenocysteine-specific translation elongation factor [Chloroflexota bacterium]